jgi:hypothetical protein
MRRTMRFGAGKLANSGGRKLGAWVVELMPEGFCA